MGKSNKEIAPNAGKTLYCSALDQEETQHVTSDPGLPTHNKHPGMKPKILPRALQIINRQLESNPKLRLRQVKEQILVIFGNISPYP